MHQTTSIQELPNQIPRSEVLLPEFPRGYRSTSGARGTATPQSSSRPCANDESSMKLPEAPIGDERRDWLPNARSDLRLATTRPQGVLLDHLSFHAQQAAEKAIRSVGARL